MWVVPLRSSGGLGPIQIPKEEPVLFLYSKGLSTPGEDVAGKYCYFLAGEKIVFISIWETDEQIVERILRDESK